MPASPRPVWPPGRRGSSAPVDGNDLPGERHLTDRVQRSGLQVAVAESLTGGLLASRLARLEGASDWFRGGVVAYAAGVKHDLLGVGPVPVVSERAALEMAAGVRALLGADLALGVTGVGGPGDQDGHPPGTVWIAVDVRGRAHAELHRFAGDPQEVCTATCTAALAHLDGALRASPRA
jgi:nicotinamide-nucleotide amidase